MLNRSIVAALAALSLGLGLTACGGDTTPTEPTTGASVPSDGLDDGTELTMWTRAPLERQAKNAVEAYNSSHKNQVKLEILPNDDVEGKVGGAIQTDTLPDILAGDVVRIPYWVEQGVFADLTKEIGTLDIDNLQKGHIDAGTIDGKMHTLPFVTDISVMVWNKDLYKEAGLDPRPGRPTSPSSSPTPRPSRASARTAWRAPTWRASRAARSSSPCSR
ncbi:ABC transporter substrate-binding protein [Tessaracoccus coleopterorum]|uniref:ABC transporter substrate-binding protein n=1 Tax=Tessaracoccus coleopterorum TaxID=2714950 RepID=UPI0018D36F4E|nr:extracellular solute-binding protein [Tessaracoccus coleopterorum]